MRPAGCDAEMLRALAEMPFIDRTDLAAVTGWSRGAVYGAVAGLDRDGLCDAVPHATGLFPAAERFHLTAAGLERLAADEGISADQLVRAHPVSARWRRILLERLDALAAVYRLAAALSGVAYPLRLRWYRGRPSTPPWPCPTAAPWASSGGATPRTAPPSPTACGSCARDRCPGRCWS